MKPILYEANTINFIGTGLGVLADCVSCPVTEERNGVFEVEFEYPITGVHYADIIEERIILVSHDEQKDLQPFVIYRRSAPINGVVTFNAHHISYNLSGVIVEPYEASNIGTAFDGFQTHAMTANPFTFWTDKSSAGTFSVKVPSSIRSLLGGSEGSILDAFGGGEYEFDNFTVKLYQNRGYDNGVTIRYGKNLTDITQEKDIMSQYNAVVPYWSDGVSLVVYGGIVYGQSGIPQVVTWTDETNRPLQDENGEVLEFHTYSTRIVPMDLTGEFDEPPTVAQLENRAETILNNNKPWIPKENIEVDFIALWQTEEYKNIAPLERVQLCDTVTVEYPALGVVAKSKVIKTVWNVLTERYDKIELGAAKTSFADTIMAETTEKIEELPSFSDMDMAIMNATNLITGGMGGHIVFMYDANGKPTDMLVMDTESTATAVHVLRINVNGIGFSSSGVQGPYTSAWTLDGHFNADWIVTGHLSASRIQGGTLVLGGINNGNGAIVVYDSSGNVIGQWDNNGIEINGGIIRTSDGARTSSIESGYTKYYSGKYASGNYIYIGDIGVMTTFNNTDDKGLGFSLSEDGDYMGWFADNGQSVEPVLMYSRYDYLSKDIYADAVNVLEDFHVANGKTIKDSRIADPKWQMSGTNYNGITSESIIYKLPVTINANGTVGDYTDFKLNFKHGVLVAATFNHV